MVSKSMLHKTSITYKRVLAVVANAALQVEHQLHTRSDDASWVNVSMKSTTLANKRRGSQHVIYPPNKFHGR